MIGLRPNSDDIGCNIVNVLSLLDSTVASLLLSSTVRIGLHSDFIVFFHLEL